MKRRVRRYLFAGLACAMLAATLFASHAAVANGLALPVPTSRDGRHDFDFEFGNWRSRLTVRRPLSNTAPWSSYVGTSIVRPIWGGQGNLGELNVSGGSRRIEGLSLRLYDATSHQWSIYFATSKSGSISVPTIGHFERGRGDFYDREIFNGKPIRVRFAFTDITRTSFVFTQAYSSDDGKTWLANWIAMFRR